MDFYLQFGSGNGPFQTVAVRHALTSMPRYGNTQSGYGYRMPTNIKILWEGRWRRVYACCYSNAATYYIGKNLAECVAKVDWSDAA